MIKMEDYQGGRQIMAVSPVASFRIAPAALVDHVVPRRRWEQIQLGPGYQLFQRVLT